MTKSDIGILFDVSGSMRSSFNSLSYNTSTKKADEILNVIDRICQRGNRLKNEQIRIFSIIFGGRNEKIYDFCNLIEIANNKFRHTLSSNHYSKASKYGYGKRFTDFYQIMEEIVYILIIFYIVNQVHPKDFVKWDAIY